MLASAIDHDEQLHWLALRLVPGLGARNAGRLIDLFGVPQAIFRAARAELEDAGVNGSVAQSIASGCAFEEAAVQERKMRDVGVELIPLRDPRFPPLLREIYDPPVVLFARGRAELLQAPMLAVVGTRRPTPYGMAVAERMAADLARSALVIVSGMARGVDTASHRGALSAGGETIAVFGCGVDVIYPAENRNLAAELAKTGLIVSEFPMGTPGQPQNFPVRNRIISGMSLGVLVVEGAQYSGSAITARLAMEQGREVFAIPGNITSKMSWGPNLLIKQGATLAQEAGDVLAELPADERRRLAERIQSKLPTSEIPIAAGTSAPDQASLPLGPAGDSARAVLALCRVDAAIHLDTILEKLDRFSSSEVIAALFDLEMTGLIRQLPGKNFVKVW
jgi:DNA processing protein